MTRVLIVGAGGLGRETAEAVHAAAAAGADLELAGFLDDTEALHGTSVDGTPVLGPLERVHELSDDHGVVLATGSPANPASRVTISARLGLPDDRYVSVVHPAASLGRTCSFGPGCIVLAGVVATAAVTVGAHVVVMPGVVLTHDDVIGAGATFGAGARLAGRVQVGSGAYIGSGALVREGLSIGAGALVGMGAVVVHDVPAGETWVGVPARPLDVRTTT